MSILKEFHSTNLRYSECVCVIFGSNQFNLNIDRVCGFFKHTFAHFQNRVLKTQVGRSLTGEQIQDVTRKRYIPADFQRWVVSANRRHGCGGNG